MNDLNMCTYKLLQYTLFPLPPTNEVEMFFGLVEVKAHPCGHGWRLQPVGSVDSLSFDGQLSDILVEQFTLRGGEGEGEGRGGEWLRGLGDDKVRNNDIITPDVCPSTYCVDYIKYILYLH